MERITTLGKMGGIGGIQSVGGMDSLGGMGRQSPGWPPVARSVAFCYTIYGMRDDDLPILPILPRVPNGDSESFSETRTRYVTTTYGDLYDNDTLP